MRSGLCTPAEALEMPSSTEAATDECDDAELRCRVAVEELSPGGQPRKRQALRAAELSLGRNERRELMLRLQAPGPTGRPRCFPLRAVRLFTRFAATGRSTLRLPTDGVPGAGSVQLLLSDCPPERLRRFLRTLRLKLAVAPGPGPASARAQLLGPRPRDFVTISPVQPEELQRAAATKAPDSALEKRPMESQTSTEAPRWPLPVKKLRMPSTKPKLSEEQAAVLRMVLKGQSIFFTGSAGTGKSYLLKHILGSLPPTGTVATASTGVAACHIGGTTLHAFAGIGSGQAPLAQCMALANRPGVRQGWLNCQRLVIDEISMVEADFFDKLEAVARAVRQQKKPFGGIQLIICGDFLQLPPVTKGSQQPQFCFQAKSWRRCVPVILELTEVWRQADQTFISLLQAVRLGRCSDEVTRQLRATAAHKVGRDGIVATRLCTHQDDVALTNEKWLKALPGDVHSFEAIDSDPELSRTLDAQCPVSRVLQLKLGAQGSPGYGSCVVSLRSSALTAGQYRSLGDSTSAGSSFPYSWPGPYPSTKARACLWTVWRSLWAVCLPVVKPMWPSPGPVASRVFVCWTLTPRWFDVTPECCISMPPCGRAGASVWSPKTMRRQTQIWRTWTQTSDLS
ncbi:expressed sequence AI449441, isoform CRA_c [Mus musculus]|nr:expressed sequence AI449441, isoform CRA_c [Mus musculus]